MAAGIAALKVLGEKAYEMTAKQSFTCNEGTRFSDLCWEIDQQRNSNVDPSGGMKLGLFGYRT